MKKLFIGLSVLSITACLLTGCNKKKDRYYKTIEDLGEFDTSSPVEITFYHTMGQESQKILNSYIKDFNQIYPNITVTHTALGGYDDVRDQLSKELGVGKQANISYCYPDHVAGYLKTNTVLDLDIVAYDNDIGYTSEELNDFVESYLNEGKAFGDGHLYCLPFSKSTEVMYYDKTFFDDHADKISVPTTWDEMEQVCKWIKENYPKDCPLGYDSGANMFITLAEQSNSPYTSVESPYFLFNNQTNIDNVDRIRQWHKLGYIETSLTYGNGQKQYTSGLFTNDDSSTPRCYMCIGSSAGASYQSPSDGRFEVGITEIPQMDVNNRKVISQGPSVCIFEDKDPQKVLASWLFVKFLTTNIEFQAQFSISTGYVPVLKSVFEFEPYVEFLSEATGTYKNIQALSCTVCANIASDYFTSPAFNGSADAREAVDELMYDAIIANSKDEVKTLFEKAISKCEYAII